jgi:hypothetical protein
MEKSPNNPKYKKWIFRVWMIVLLLVVIWSVGRGTYIRNILENNGKCTKAVVYKRKKQIGSKGHIITYYKFVWKDNTYYGRSPSDTKYRQTDNFFHTSDDLITGDSIMIVFCETNPNINRSARAIKMEDECK